MLEGLDAVDWPNLKHAYGPAADVPGQLRDLASPEKEVRDKAAWHLYGNIFHQGTRYEATPHAVPFIYEILAAAEPEQKAELVDLLVHLALGYPDEFTVSGFQPRDFRAAAKEAEEESTPQAREAWEKYGTAPRFCVQCYDAVRAGVPHLCAMLEEQGGPADLHCAVLHALAWFPEESTRTVPAIERVLRETPHDAVTSSALLALGLVERGGTGASFTIDPRDYVSQDRSRTVRVSAAIAATPRFVDDAVVEAMIEGLTGTEQLRNESGDIRFNESDLTGYAGRMLAKYGHDQRGRIVDHIGKALEVSDAYRSLDLTSAILALIVPEQGPALSDRTVGDLNDVQRTGLTAIALHGGWSMGNAIFGNYANLVRGYGVPDRQESLCAFLGLPPPPKTTSPATRQPWWKRWFPG